MASGVGRWSETSQEHARYVTIVTYPVKAGRHHKSRVPSDDPYRGLCRRIVDHLRAERERQGLSKYAVEQRAGVSQQMVGYVERGLRSPSLEVALRMAAALDLDLGEVIKAARQARGRPKDG